MPIQNGKHGGRRKGAGRPKKKTDKKVSVTASLTSSEITKIEMLFGSLTNFVTEKLEKL